MLPSYLAPKRGSPRMFKSSFFEAFTKVHPATPFLLYFPIVVYFLYLQKGRFFAISFFFLLGLFCWTLFEYTLHRFIFHFTPKSKIGFKLFFIIHGVHHEYPWDTRRLVMPPVVSITIAIIVWILSKYIFGKFAYAFFSGMATGYIIYDTTHYLIHATKPPKFLRWLWKHHFRHHFSNPGKNFGVSSPLWDYIFSTKH